MSNLARLVLIGVAVVAAPSPALAATEAVEAERVPHVWHFDPEDWDGRPVAGRIEPSVFVERPTAALRFEASAVRMVFLRRLRWQGWGTARAIVRGQARYCEYPTPCTAWQPITIRLTNRASFRCGHFQTRYSAYTRYRVTGSPDLISSRTRRAAPGC